MNSPSFKALAQIVIEVYCWQYQRVTNERADGRTIQNQYVPTTSTCSWGRNKAMGSMTVNSHLNVVELFDSESDFFYFNTSAYVWYLF